MYYRAVGTINECKRCSLSTGKAIHGQSEVPLKDVKLIVISAYPSTEEVKQRASLVSSTTNKLNAGKYCRKAISAVFDADDRIPTEYKPFVERVFFTNIIRCSPLGERGKKRDVTDTHIKQCNPWFDHELTQLPDGVPILIASSEALKALIGESSVYQSRGQLFNYKQHPVMVTMNPIEPTRYLTYQIDSLYKTKHGAIVPNKISPMRPVLLSVPWLFNRDLIMVKEEVIKYINKGI
jgi:hypothetical protein